jgi:hypothetical protein
MTFPISDRIVLITSIVLLCDILKELQTYLNSLHQKKAYLKSFEEKGMDSSFHAFSSMNKITDIKIGSDP